MTERRDRSSAAFLKEQLTKPPKESKKWRMAVIGLQGVAIFFLAGVAMFFAKPDLATQMTTLIQFAITGWSGIIALFIGAQGVVDSKTVTALSKPA